MRKVPIQWRFNKQLITGERMIDRQTHRSQQKPVTAQPFTKIAVMNSIPIGGITDYRMKDVFHMPP